MQRPTLPHPALPSWPSTHRLHCNNAVVDPFPTDNGKGGAANVGSNIDKQRVHGELLGKLDDLQTRARRG